MRNGNGLGALRRERSSFAALGVLLLLAQLLLAGFSQGAMAAERLARPDLGAICHTAETGNRLLPGERPGEPERLCPCLAGVCVVSLHALLPEGGTAALLPLRSTGADPPAPARPGIAPRPPFELFARAGRGPPAIG